MKKSCRIVFAVLAAAVLVGGAVLRYALRWENVSFTAAALCVVGLAISFDCKIDKYRVPLRVLQGLAALVIAVNVASWFFAMPHWYELALNLAALAVNIPLAALGFKKN